MKRQSGREPDFVTRFEPEEAVLRLPNESVDPVEDVKSIEHGHAQRDSKESHDGDASPLHAIKVVQPTGGLQAYRWAVSKYAGRSHSRDTWELDLKKGERVKVLDDRGKDWFLVENSHGIKGYAHGSWLDFRELRAHIDPREAYTRWTADTDKWLQLGAVRTFLSPTSYMNACTKDTCQPLKHEGVGVCVHDLHELLRGSGQYSLDFLRAQRNRYHPDKFARFCHPDYKEELKTKAEGLFVLFGVLMDRLENPLTDGNAK